MKKRFTLIELMVVIGIIGILSAIVLASFAGSRSKAQDARRVSDIGQIQVALESYFKDYKTSTTLHINDYPAALSDIQPKYISVVPTDPKTQAAYSYQLNTGSQSYCVGAQLENTNNVAITQNTSCNGINWCTLTTNYKVCRQ